jgi:hypothetical protein
MARELTKPNKFGGGALVTSGVLFVVLAFLDFRAGPPPSNGTEILLWRDSQALVLDFVSEFLFFAQSSWFPEQLPGIKASLMSIEPRRRQAAELSRRRFLSWP